MRFRGVDGKAQKRYDVLRQKLQQRRQQLAGAKRQPDDPEEIPRLEKEIRDIEAEMTKLKG